MSGILVALGDGSVRSLSPSLDPTVWWNALQPADGNVLTKTAPAPNQTGTASTAVTTYSYDALNRLTQKGRVSFAEQESALSAFLTTGTLPAN